MSAALFFSPAEKRRDGELMGEQQQAEESMLTFEASQVQGVDGIIEKLAVCWAVRGAIGRPGG
jgi:hypothetical protein